MPKVSVLLPVYNTPALYLRECIDSILSQTFKDFELIIVNDGSADQNVERVIKSYEDPRIRYYLNEKNLGISETRNRLIDLSQGEYLAVHDHDDVCRILLDRRRRPAPVGRRGQFGECKLLDVCADQVLQFLQPCVCVRSLPFGDRGTHRVHRA